MNFTIAIVLVAYRKSFPIFDVSSKLDMFEPKLRNYYNVRLTTSATVYNLISYGKCQNRQQINNGFCQQSFVPNEYIVSDDRKSGFVNYSWNTKSIDFMAIKFN